MADLPLGSTPKSARLVTKAAPEKLPPRLIVADATVEFLQKSTAAGNSSARLAMKDSTCPRCHNPTLIALARFAKAENVGYRRVRRYEVVAQCKTALCDFVGATTGKFMME